MVDSRGLAACYGSIPALLDALRRETESAALAHSAPNDIFVVGGGDVSLRLSRADVGRLLALANYFDAPLAFRVADAQGRAYGEHLARSSGARRASSARDKRHDGPPVVAQPDDWTPHDAGF